MAKVSTVVQAIKNEMERRELTAFDVSKLAGVSHVNLYAILRGEVISPGLAVLEKVARVLKLRVTVE